MKIDLVGPSHRVSYSSVAVESSRADDEVEEVDV